MGETSPNWKNLQTTKYMQGKNWHFVLWGIEYIIGKGENASCQHFLLSKQCFQKACISMSFNSLPYDKFMDWSKFKAFADDKRDWKSEICFGKVENIVGKEENAGYQHFFPFSTMFSEGL